MSRENAMLSQSEPRIMPSSSLRDELADQHYTQIRGTKDQEIAHPTKVFTKKNGTQEEINEIKKLITSKKEYKSIGKN